jgi:hypothetical protein
MHVPHHTASHQSMPVFCLLLMASDATHCSLQRMHATEKQYKHGLGKCASLPCILILGSCFSSIDQHGGRRHLPNTGSFGPRRPAPEVPTGTYPGTYPVPNAIAHGAYCWPCNSGQLLHLAPKAPKNLASLAVSLLVRQQARPANAETRTVDSDSGLGQWTLAGRDSTATTAEQLELREADGRMLRNKKK